MAIPSADLSGCVDAQARLERALVGLTDDVVRQPSRLPRWTVGHLLTHFARNADSVTRRLDGAARDEVVEQYIGGAVGRAAEIEAGATRSLAALIADVASSARRLQAAALAMRDDAWDRPTLAVGGEIQPAWVLIRRRWREVEVHHVDLGLGYEPRDWPAAFVETCLPELLAALPARLDAHEFVAWAFDRGAAPSLRSYG